MDALLLTALSLSLACACQDQAIRDAFDEIDMDGSGSLDKEELKLLGKRMGAPSLFAQSCASALVDGASLFQAFLFFFSSSSLS